MLDRLVGAADQPRLNAKARLGEQCLELLWLVELEVEREALLLTDFPP